MGEELAVAIVLRFVKEAIPLVIPPLWNGLRMAVGRRSVKDSAHTDIDAILVSHSQRLSQVQSDLQTQAANLEALERRIRLMIRLAILSTSLSIVAVIAVIMIAIAT